MTGDIAGVCTGCGAAVRNSEAYTFVEAMVWERLGPKGRGSRTVVERRTTGRVRCSGCLPGIDHDQLDMSPFDV